MIAIKYKKIGAHFPTRDNHTLNNLELRDRDIIAHFQYQGRQYPWYQ